MSAKAAPHLKRPFWDISSFLCVHHSFLKSFDSSRFNLLPSQIHPPSRWDRVSPGQSPQDRGWCDGDGTRQPCDILRAQSSAHLRAGRSHSSLAMVPQSLSSLQLGLGSAGCASPMSPNTTLSVPAPCPQTQHWLCQPHGTHVPNHSTGCASPVSPQLP